MTHAAHPAGGGSGPGGRDRTSRQPSREPAARQPADREAATREAAAGEARIPPPEQRPAEQRPPEQRQSEQRQSPLQGQRDVLEPDEIRRALTRIAHEILERTSGASDVVLLGLPTRGVPLARRLAARMEQVEERPIPVGSLDVTMYRDDLRLRPARALRHTEIPATGVDGKIVVLVDDVLYSGRTVRAALDALGDVGRPRAVQLAVLIDRGHRELPVRPDYVGKNLPTSRQEVVRVLLTEVDGQDAVRIGTSQDARPGPGTGPGISGTSAGTSPGQPRPGQPRPRQPGPGQPGPGADREAGR
jgi:pyrimidine operon attenuation protein/uracil phosphoribosyltransferase